MTTDIDPAFVDRCAAAATALRQLADLGERPETDDAAVGRAAYLTAELLADPEALLAVALTIEQARAGATGPGQRIVALEAALRSVAKVLGSVPDEHRRWDASLPEYIERLADDAVNASPPGPGGSCGVCGRFPANPCDRGQSCPRAAPPRPDDLSTLGRGETRLVGGKMWARCEDCGFVGPLAGLGTWHVCDPVTEAGPLGRQR